MSQFTPQQLNNVLQHQDRIIYLEQNNVRGLERTQSFMWTETLKNAGNASKSEVLRRIFKLLYFGGLRYRTRENASWRRWNMPVARALSHGGRVLIQFDQVKPGDDPHAFWNWLRGNCHDFYPRVGTHGIAPSTDWERIGGESIRASKETHGGGRGIAQNSRKSKNEVSKISYGLNVAFGGYGKKSISGRGNGLITDTGEYGTLYFYYRAPNRQKPGGLLVGLESDAPGMWGETGNFHSWNIAPVDWIKNYKNGKLNVPTGTRWSGKGVGPMKYDGMFLDLTRCGWRRVANGQNFTNDMVGTWPHDSHAVSSAAGGRNGNTVFGQDWYTRWTDWEIREHIKIYRNTNRHENVVRMETLYNILDRAHEIMDHSVRNFLLRRDAGDYNDLANRALDEMNRICLAQH